MTALAPAHAHAVQTRCGGDVVVAAQVTSSSTTSDSWLPSVTVVNYPTFGQRHALQELTSEYGIFTQLMVKRNCRLGRRRPLTPR